MSNIDKVLTTLADVEAQLLRAKAEKNDYDDSDDVDYDDSYDDHDDSYDED